MNLLIDMPVSTFSLSAEDDSRVMEKVAAVFVAKLRVFTSYGPPSINHMPLVTAKDQTHYEIRTGLVPKFKQLMQANGVVVNEMDIRKTPRPDADLCKGTMSLRDYQQEVVDQALQHDMGLIHAATGAGKTHMGAAIIRARSVPTLFLVHTKELLWQTKKRFEEVLGVPIGVVGDSEREFLPVTVSTVQTIAKLTEAGFKWPVEVGMIIQDECHHVSAPMFYNVTGSFPCRYIYGLTATPKRTDGGDILIEAACGPIVAKIGADDLIARGVLSRPIVRFVPVMGEMSYSNAPQFAIINKYIVNDMERNRTIVRLALEQAARKKTVLISVNWVKHAVTILEAFKEQGMPKVPVLEGKTPSEKRKAMLANLGSKKDLILISTLMKEGVDVPSLDVVINAAGGTNPMQLIGRVLRKAEGKEACLVIDFIDNRHQKLFRYSQARMAKCRKQKEFQVITG